MACAQRLASVIALAVGSVVASSLVAQPGDGGTVFAQALPNPYRMVEGVGPAPERETDGSRGQGDHRPGWPPRLGRRPL